MTAKVCRAITCNAMHKKISYRGESAVREPYLAPELQSIWLTCHCVDWLMSLKIEGIAASVVTQYHEKRYCKSPCK